MVPETDVSQRSGRRRAAAVRLGGSALLAQGISSASNLLVSIYVAKMLGPTALGRFALLFAILLTVVSIQTGWVGDSLTVLTRTDQEIKRGLSVTQWGMMTGGALLGMLLAMAVPSLGVLGILAFGVLTAMWQLEEYGRRVFMARLEFLGLAGNDGIYLVTVFCGLIVFRVQGPSSLAPVLMIMAAGSLAASVASYVVLPPSERLMVSNLRGPGFSAVASYGAWRSAQAGIGTLSGTVLRFLVTTMAGAAALGSIEAARLVVAPLLTLLGASTNLMLPLFARARDRGVLRKNRIMVLAAACLSVPCVAYGFVILALPRQAVALVAGPKFVGERVSLAGWIAVAIAVAISTPPAMAVLAEGGSARLFAVRLGGIGLTIVIGIVFLVVRRPDLVPFSLAIASGWSGWWLWRQAAGRCSSGYAVEGDVFPNRGESLSG